MAQPVGIDLGTSNSVVSVFRGDKPQTVPVEGRTTTPSVISVSPDGRVVVGDVARRRALIEPACTIAAARRFLGHGETTWRIFGETYTPVDVCALILGRLKEAAETHLGRPVTEAVIAVPAYSTK